VALIAHGVVWLSVCYDDDGNDNIIDQAHKIFIKLCYDGYTKQLMIVSNLWYKMGNVEIVDEKSRSVSSYKKKTIMNDILVKFLERFNIWFQNNKEIPNILDLIIHKINLEYRTNITKNDVILQQASMTPVSQATQAARTRQPLSSKNSQMIMPKMLAKQILLYKKKQIKEDTERLQKSFYELNKSDKVYFILLNENEGDYYINIIYQDNEGESCHLISTNITNASLPEKDIIIGKITKQINRYKMAPYIKEDIASICDKKFR
jgi:hypothetical protein